MKTTELLNELNTTIKEVGTTFLTTIHLINGNRILTDITNDDDKDYENEYYGKEFNNATI